jgi:hypothetical protein
MKAIMLPCSNAFRRATLRITDRAIHEIRPLDVLQPDSFSLIQLPVLFTAATFPADCEGVHSDTWRRPTPFNGLCSGTTVKSEMTMSRIITEVRLTCRCTTDLTNIRHPENSIRRSEEPVVCYSEHSAPGNAGCRASCCDDNHR